MIATFSYADTSREETINTSDKRKLDMQIYAQYRIENPTTYKMKVGSLSKLNQFLKYLSRYRQKVP